MSTQLQPLNAAQKFKKSDICVFLGCGESINQIPPEEWEAIRLCDSWALNNWVYHPIFVPNFYHIEVKHYDYNIVARRIEEKRERYRSVAFIFEQGRHIKWPDGTVKPLHMVVGDMPHKFEYTKVPRDPRRTDNPYTANYSIRSDVLTKSYQISLTTVLEMIHRFGYRAVVFYGVDLKNSRYFWTGGDPIFGEVHHQWNKQHEGKDPNQPHATVGIHQFIFDFHQRHMLPQQRALYTGHKETLLYPGLECRTVRSLL